MCMEKEGKKKLRFAIFGNVYQAKKSASIQKILSYLSEREADVFMEREFYDFVTKGQHLEVQVTRVFEGMTSKPTSLSPWEVTVRY